MRFKDYEANLHLRGKKIRSTTVYQFIIIYHPH